MGPKLRATVVLLFVFALGVFAGIAFERHHSAPPVATISATVAHEAAMADLKEKLDLDDEQLAQIHRVLVEHRDAVQKSWEAVRPEVQDAMRQVHLEIAEVLRPEQREAYHRWLMRHRDQSERARSRNPHDR